MLRQEDNGMNIEITDMEIYWLEDLLAGEIHEGTDHMDELEGEDLVQHNSYIEALNSILKKIKR